MSDKNETSRLYLIGLLFLCSLVFYVTWELYHAPRQNVLIGDCIKEQGFEFDHYNKRHNGSKQSCDVIRNDYYITKENSYVDEYMKYCKPYNNQAN
jgi:hypothetical protein